MRRFSKCCLSSFRTVTAVILCGLAGATAVCAPASAEDLGRVAWPYRFNREHYEFLGDLVVAFEAMYPEEAKGLKFSSDDKASVGRFADKDDPFGVLIDRPTTKDNDHRLFLRFGREGKKPSQEILAQRRLIVVASRDLYLERISQSGLRWLLREGDANWPEAEQEKQQRSSTRVLLDGDGQSWTNDYVIKNVLVEEKVNDEGRLLSVRAYRLRKDIVRPGSAEKVLAEVRRGRESVGILMYKVGLDFTGVDVLAARNHWKDEWVTPDVQAVMQPEYRLGEIFVLYRHPSAPPAAEVFCRWAIGPEGAGILERCGLQTEYESYFRQAAQRLDEAKSGKGPRISSVGDRSFSPIPAALSTEYVRAKAVVQMGYGAADSDVAAVGAFTRAGAEASPAPASMPTTAPALLSPITPFVAAGGKELLFLSDKPSARAMELHGQKWNALGSTPSAPSAGSGQASLTTGQLNGTGPAEYMLAGRAAAVIVNPANKIDALTIGQLQAIFGGEVADWAVIGGAGLATSGHGKSQIGGSEIRAIGLRGDDLATGIFEKECLERARWKRVGIKKDSAEVLAAVSMDPQAIGFVDLAGIPATGQNVRILGIRLGSPPPPAGAGTSPRGGGVYFPTPENIRSAMYPLSQRLWLYVHPQASDTAKDFVKFITTCGASEASPYADTVKAVMDTYRKNGLVPLADAALLRMTKDAMAEDAARAKAEEGKKKVGRQK